MVRNLDPGSAKYVSTVSLGELAFGLQLATLRNRAVPSLRQVLDKARNYAVLGPTEHTSKIYGELKARVAEKYLRNVTRLGRPRRVEDWVNHVTGKLLQIDENDLWQCAQARERNCILVTADKGIQRIADADSELRVKIV